MKSIFADKNTEPTIQDLKKALGKTFLIWKNVEDFLLKAKPDATAVWHFSSTKYGWSYRIKDNKRVLLYLLPRDNFFKAAFVFSQKATEQILLSEISEDIKTDLRNAKAYTEGRGIRIEIKDASKSRDIKELIKIKIAH
ncbi:DUF3788 family protein [Aurantibacillus circumpalustris]|uniref:DUF3788 family protein n=1 Tax=Aurantibacillus circumpalustris TaxID=3036359 RepID=UPI00295B331B|nr:DUF3788 family protein [Aurantibacillus circumpalustris]